MKIAVASLKSMACPYSQSRHHDTPKLDKELPKDFEARTWRNRMHVTADGNVFIPPMSFKNCLSECAKYLGIQIPGQGKKNYTAKFEAGLLVTDPVVLPILAKDVPGEWLFVPSDGKRGGGKRVDRCFPRIEAWEADVRFYVLDNTITESVFKQHLEEAGKFIGIGRFRPRNNGYYGRFLVQKVEWIDG